MATSPTEIKGSPRGITNTLTGFVVESENISDAPVQEEFDDQVMGARADEQVYDNRVDLKITVYGASGAASPSAQRAAIALDKAAADSERMGGAARMSAQPIAGIVGGFAGMGAGMDMSWAASRTTMPSIPFPSASASASAALPFPSPA
jgi:hypothetical protein